MPTIELKHSILQYIQEINQFNHKSDDWKKWLPEIGCPIDYFDEEKIEIEVFPDRPDLLSHETLARACRSFTDEMKFQESELEIKNGDIEIKVESDMEKIRPVILGAVVRGVKIGRNEKEKNDFIQSLMDHQEKLHLTLGRRREFASIGVHDLTNIKPPFRYITVDEKFSFIPLAEEKEMSIKDILQKNSKGKEYAHLMKDLKKYPVILDYDDNVLSFPPIINGNHTTVTESTEDFFIDVTGWNRRSCEACLLLICLSLSERGGDIEVVNFIDLDGSEYLSPLTERKKHRVPDKLITKILDIEMDNEQISRAIAKMGGELIETRTVTDGPNNTERWIDCEIGEKEHIIAMPRWRSDIMHPIDIVEDLAIGFGFNNLPKKTSSIHIDSIPLNSSNLFRRVGESLRASSLQEIQSLTLSNEKDQFGLMRWEKNKSVTVISNPITIDHTILRQYILPSLLRLLSANRHYELPQRVYEIGDVVRDDINQKQVAWACAEVGSGFTTAKGITMALLKDLGTDLETVSFEATNERVGPWIKGRGAIIHINGEKIGEIGEIDPEVSESFGLKSPIHAGEFDLEAIGRLINDPVL